MLSFPQASEDPVLNFTLHTVELHAPDLAAADAARAQAGPPRAVCSHLPAG